MDSMEREIEGGSPSFIRHRANRSYEMQNEYLLNCEELLENQRFVFFKTFMTNKLEKDFYKIWLSMIYYMINQYLQMMQ